MFKKLLYLLIGLTLLVVSLWWTRYQVVAAATPEVPAIFRIDRFTGKAEVVFLLGGKVWVFKEGEIAKEVSKKKPTALEFLKEEAEKKMREVPK